MALDLGDGRKRDFYDLTIRTKYLDARGSEGLSCFHAANGSANTSAVDSDDLDVIFSIERL